MGTREQPRSVTEPENRMYLPPISPDRTSPERNQPIQMNGHSNFTATRLVRESTEQNGDIETSGYDVCGTGRDTTIQFILSCENSKEKRVVHMEYDMETAGYETRYHNSNGLMHIFDTFDLSHSRCQGSNVKRAVRVPKMRTVPIIIPYAGRKLKTSNCLACTAPSSTHGGLCDELLPSRFLQKSATPAPCLDEFRHSSAPASPKLSGFELLDSMDSDFQTPSMKTVGERIQSFHTKGQWRCFSVMPFDLARAGYFYTGIASFVECFSCGMRVYDWMPGDDPIYVHRYYAERPCPYLSKLLTMDLPQEPSPRSLVHTSMLGPQYFPRVKNHDSMRTFRGDKVPEYASELERRNTFYRYPWNLDYPWATMVEAGFFRSEHMITCYYCGLSISLDGWQRHMDPKEVHQRLFPQCFLNVLRQKPPTQYQPDDLENDVRQCLICVENLANIVSLTCLHVIGCIRCTSRLRKCPLCSKPLDDIMQIYISV